jgi:NAD(P)-dependent dehydrogenase (short-subunit alcohol dehydrogenase family)
MGIRKKPAPDSLFAVMKKLGAKKETTVYVGDSEVDIQTAKNAGVDCISVTWGFKDRGFLIDNGASRLVDSPNEIFNYCSLKIGNTPLVQIEKLGAGLQVFAKIEKENGGGSIINTGSMSAWIINRPEEVSYSTSKAGVHLMTKGLACTWAKYGIRVNAIAPGFFATNQNRALLFNEDGSLTARSGKILSQTPMNRFGEPEELLGTLRFLIDNNASGFITGVTIPVDGGFSAYSGV